MRKFSSYIVISIILFSCNLSSGVFEKNFAIPDQAWQSSVKPDIGFTIKDTASLYNIFFVIRHSDAYNYNNIWIRASLDRQEESDMKSQQYDLSLATNDRGWLGSAMDDIYEARLLIQPRIRFKRPGDYHIILEQIMREDPLKHVLDVGIRLEKISPGE